MKLCNIGHNFDYEMEKLIRLFLPFEKITVLHTEEYDDRYAVCSLFENGDDRILMIPECAELLLEGVKEDDEKKHISIPARYEDLEILIVKV